MSPDQKIALLGDIDEGGVIEPRLELLKPLKQGNVINAFCKKCGSYHGLAYPVAEKIFLAMQAPLDFENKYLVFGSCSRCEGEDTVEIKTF